MILLRASIYLTVLKVCFVSHSYCCDIERLIPDFADLYSMSHVAVVISTEELKQPIKGLGVAYISYMNVNLHEVVEYIDGIQDELEAIFFIGSDHSEIITMLHDSTDVFHSHIVNVMQNQDTLGLFLRLDTNIIFCTLEDSHFALTERYAVKEGTPAEKYIGNWNPESGLNIDIPLLWERRSDLRNVEVVDSVLEYSVVSQLFKNEEGDIMKQSGIGPDILAVLGGKLNFSTRAVSPADGLWGSIKADNVTWNGIAGDLVYKRADISTASLVRTYERSNAIDFSMAFVEFTATLIQPTTVSSEINPWSYLTIFPLLAWIIILGMVLIVALLVMVIVKYCETIDIGLADAITISFLYLIQWSHETPTLLQTKAAKVGLFTWAIGSYVVFSFYEADLTAVMTSGAQESNIK